MLKSDSRRFIFVHIQKTGGSSVKQAIRRHVPDARRFLGTHDGAGPGQQELGRRWNKYFSFAVVRNPWDRLVSWYSMISQVDFERRPKHRKNRFWRYVRENSSSFEEFLVNCTDVIEDFDGRKSILFNQFDYVSDDRGRLRTELPDAGLRPPERDSGRGLDLQPRTGRAEEQEIGTRNHGTTERTSITRPSRSA